MANQETNRNEDSSGAKSATTHYDITALELTIYYNREGDHDHNGMIFALTENVPILKYIRALGRSAPPRNSEDDDLPATFEMAARTRAAAIGVELPITPAQARQGQPVLNEEQHHSSWMFGDPVTPILKAYIGDPVRIRFVHGGVKETHVFHLHMYEWHAVPEDWCSPRINAISVSPQTAHTIEPVWGAGNRHQVAGDVIWHCHLYPHFHEGMWGSKGCCRFPTETHRPFQLPTCPVIRCTFPVRRAKNHQFPHGRIVNLRTKRELNPSTPLRRT